MVCDSLLPGGWLAVSLLGDRDAWAPSQDVTFLAAREARGLMEGLTVVKFEEREEDRPAYRQERKHWHLYEIIARRPGQSQGAGPV